MRPRFFKSMSTKECKAGELKVSQTEKCRDFLTGGEATSSNYTNHLNAHTCKISFDVDLGNVKT